MGTFVPWLHCALAGLLLGCGPSTGAGPADSPASTIVVPSATTTMPVAGMTTTIAPTTSARPTPAATDPEPTVPPDAGTWRVFAVEPGGSRRFLAWTGTEAIVLAEPEGSDARITLRALDPAAGTWRLLPPVAADVNGLVAAWTGKDLLVFDGRVGAAYSATMDRWRALAPLPVVITSQAWAWTGTQLLLWGFEAPAGGGQIPSDAVAVALSYDPATNHWTTLPETAVPGGVPWFGELAWTGGEVLATGLTTAQGLRDGTDAYPGTRPLAYDPTTAAWRATTPYPFTVNVTSLTAVAGRSQYWLHQPWDGPLSMFVYDADADRWTTLNAPPGSGAIGAFGSAGDRLFAVRGTGAALYDPATDAWQSTSPPPTVVPCGGCAPQAITERSGGARVVWTGRAILVVGQESEIGGPDSFTYTPTWSETGDGTRLTRAPVEPHRF